MPEEAPILTATVSVQMKVNIGNYESADCFISVSGITDYTTADEVASLLDGPAKIAYDALKVRLGERVAAIRAGAKR